jgi:hypothetical protein
LLDCFQVDKSKEFETFLHYHPDISHNKVCDLFGHERENELFLIGHKLSYQTIIKIINDNVDNYNYKIRELLLENENLKMQIESLKLQKPGVDQHKANAGEIDEILQSNKGILGKIASLERTIQQLFDNVNKPEPKLVTGFNQQLPQLGPRLQKINPDSMQLVQVYESVTEAMNENKSIKRSSINKAAENNTIYRGFRWVLVERNSDANVVRSIEPTKPIQQQDIGYVAKFDANKSKILNVYLDRKTATRFNGYKTSSALDRPVKEGILSHNHYYIPFSKCNQELITIFEEMHGPVILYKAGIGQFNSNHQLVREYTCKYDCIRERKISEKTLAKCLENNTQYDGYYYKKLGEKLIM